VFEVNGITALIAESFARIFVQNMFNCGMAAIELPKADLDLIFSHAGDDDATMSIDIEAQTLTMSGVGKQKSFDFQISPFDKALVLAGGWVDYADQKYLSSGAPPPKTKSPAGSPAGLFLMHDSLSPGEFRLTASGLPAPFSAPRRG
jgi:3-isopropylmalate dehydratase small subunit